ncbi:helix-turn-helix domain-containing protein [Paenibacillus selenitireducens]|nr:helix-turn-helix domain-containing protein [Paenibacillus selenitireducens]
MTMKLRSFLFSGKYYARLIGFGFMTVCIPIVLASFLAYSMLSRNLEEQVKQANLQTMLQIQARIDAELNTVVKATRGLVFDSSIQKYFYKTDLNDYTEMMDVQKKLSALERSIEHSTRIGLFLPSQKIELTTTVGYERIDDPAGKYSYVGTNNPDSPMRWIPNGQEGSGSFTFVQSLPAISNTPQAYLTVDLNKRALADIMNTGGLGESGRMMVMSESGVVVSLIERSKDGQSRESDATWKKNILNASEQTGFYKDSSRNTLSIFTKSSVNGWTTVLDFPLTELNGQRANVGRLTVIVCLGALALGMLLLYINSRKLYAPIRKLLGQEQTAGDTHSTKIDEWTWIRNNWDQLKLQVGALREQSSRNAPLLRDVFFMNMVYGQYAHEPLDRLTELCNLHGVSAHAKWKVFVVEAENHEMYDKFRKEDRQLILLAISSICQDIANQHNIKAYFINGVEAAQVIVVLQMSPEWSDKQLSAVSYQVCESVRMSIDTYLKFNASVGIGNTYNHIQNVRLSCMEAKEALKYRIVKGGNRTIGIQDLRPDRDALRYPFELEATIMRELQNGDRVRTMEAFALFAQTVTSRDYPASQVYQAFHMLYVSFFHKLKELSDEGVHQLSETDAFERISASRTVVEIETWFRDVIFPILFPRFEEAIDGKGKHLVERAKKYMIEAVNLDHTLQSVASYVDLSPSYFSRMFQKYTGQSFTSYVSELKIERAKELLVHTNEPIAAIAEKINYTERSFRRVFKNLTGHSPATYREQGQNPR